MADGIFQRSVEPWVEGVREDELAATNVVRSVGGEHAIRDVVTGDERKDVHPSLVDSSNGGGHAPAGGRAVARRGELGRSRGEGAIGGGDAHDVGDVGWCLGRSGGVDGVVVVFMRA